MVMYNLRTSKKHNYKDLKFDARSRDNNMRRNSLEESSCADTLVPDSPESPLKDPLNEQDLLDNDNVEDVPREDQRCENLSQDKIDGNIHSPSSGTQTGHGLKTDPIEVVQRVSSAADAGTPMEVNHRVSFPKESSENAIIVSQNLSGRQLRRLGTSTIQQIVSFPSNSLAYGPEHGEGHVIQSTNRESEEGAIISLKKATKSNNRIELDDFTMDPFDKPDIAPTAKQQLPSSRMKRLEEWLEESPYRIWVTKCAASEPYAVCKYGDCRHVFRLKDNPTSSNIIAHLQKNHKWDFELFHRRLKAVQPQLSEFEGIPSINEKPLRLRRELLHFLCSNELMINQVNLFIETIIPFSAVEAPAFRKMLEYPGARSHICSRKGIVNMMVEYEDQFNLQMRDMLGKSSNFNVHLDMWTSSDEKGYLAILLSFCPNLRRDRGRLTIQDVTTEGTPNVHIIDFVDLGQRRHNNNNLKEKLLRSFGKLSITNKISSVTVKSGSNNISMLSDLDDDLREGPGVNKVGGLVKIRCMNHSLNQMFQDIMIRFEKSETQLLSRIDRLTVALERNVLIRNKVRELTQRTVPSFNYPQSVSRYRQLSVFLKLTGPLKDFYFENRLDGRYQLTPDDMCLFCYEPSEIEALKIFLRLTRIFDEYTMLLQDDMLDNLPNGVEYYLHIDDFFKSCKEVKNGSTDRNHLRALNLKMKHLFSLEQSVLTNLLSIVEDAYPKFQKYMNLAFAEPGYWVAHLLQPFCKTNIIKSAFEEDKQQQILDLSRRYVNHHLSQFRSGLTEPKSRQTLESSVESTLDARRKNYRICKQLRRHRRKYFVNPTSSRSEWDAYLAEPVRSDTNYLEYWIANQEKYPGLFELALSFHHTKLSTADAGRCLSIGHRVLESRFSLSSTNLKRTMILRNRLKCFGMGHNLQKVDDISLEQWILDEETEERSESTGACPEEMQDWSFCIPSSSDSDLSEEEEEEEE